LEIKIFLKIIYVGEVSPSLHPCLCPAKAGCFAATQLRGRLPPTEIKFYYERKIIIRITPTEENIF
jgi:hypothetical protein